MLVGVAHGPLDELLGGNGVLVKEILKHGDTAVKVNVDLREREREGEWGDEREREGEMEKND